MYQVSMTRSFSKDTERCKKRGYDMQLLRDAIKLLAEDGKLPMTYRPHKLSGKYSNYCEAHIKGDWLLLWLQDDDKLTLLFTGTGTHSDIFG